MDQSEYLEQRVDDQIDWYDNKSQWNQKAFKRLRTAEVVAAALIPLLSGYAKDGGQLYVVVGLLGLAVAVIAGVVSLYRFQENWTEYRVTCEALKHEKFLFLTGTGPYDVSEPFPMFVERTEGLISKEHTKWTKHMRAIATEPAGGASHPGQAGGTEEQHRET